MRWPKEVVLKGGQAPMHPTQAQPAVNRMLWCLATLQNYFLSTCITGPFITGPAHRRTGDGRVGDFGRICALLDAVEMDVSGAAGRMEASDPANAANGAKTTLASCTLHPDSARRPPPTESTLNYVRVGGVCWLPYSVRCNGRCVGTICKCVLQQLTNSTW